jgi:hypothetical protein
MSHVSDLEKRVLAAEAEAERLRADVAMWQQRAEVAIAGPQPLTDEQIARGRNVVAPRIEARRIGDAPTSFSDGPELRVFKALLSALGGIVELEGEVRAAVSECARMVAQESPPASWRWFLVLGDDASPSEHVASSVSVEHVGSHDRVRVWSRGGHAGELVMSEGDGEAFAKMLGLRERMSANEPIRIVSDLTSAGAARDEERELIDQMRAPPTERDEERELIDQMRAPPTERDEERGAYEEGMEIGMRAYEEGMEIGMRRDARLIGMVRTCFESYRSAASPDPAQLIAAIGSLLGVPT